MTIPKDFSFLYLVDCCPSQSEHCCCSLQVYFTLTQMFVCVLTGDFTPFKASHVAGTRPAVGRSYLDHGELLLPPSCNLPKTPDLHLQVGLFVKQL